MNSPEIRALAAVYRAGMPFIPPRDAEERSDFYASPHHVDYQKILKRYADAACRLTTKDAEGNEIPSESASSLDQQAYLEARRDCEEARDALRADWYRRRVERIEGRSIEVEELREYVEVNIRTLHAGESR